MPIFSNKDVERAIGDQFVRLYSNRNEANYKFQKQAGDGEAPDLYYAPDLELEITQAFNFEGDAKDIADLRRSKRIQTSRACIEPDEQLKKSIGDRLREKCVRSYGAACILVVYAEVPLLDKDEMDRFVPDIPIPHNQPFAKIFLMCRLPPGIFEIWQLA
jgi:hypothetical protein